MKDGIKTPLKTLHDCGDDYVSFLAQSDPAWIFTKGACHAYALELQEHFKAPKGTTAEVYYSWSALEGKATHVFIRNNDTYCDVLGSHTRSEIAQAWSNSDPSKLGKVPNPSWITTANPDYPPNMSYLGLCVIPDFLVQARKLAHSLIKQRGF